jgi:signal transduction histidine kinase
LVGALAAVVAVALLVVTLTTGVVAARQFGLYTVRGGQVWANQLVPILAERYAADGSWQNIQPVLLNPWQEYDGMGRRLGAMGPMMGQGGPRMQGADGDSDMWSAMNIHLLLADSQGTIVGDTQNMMRGQPMSADLVRQGTPVVSAGKRVGTLVVLASEPGVAINRPNSSFLFSAGRSVLFGALAAGLVGVILGTVLFRRITHPLNALQKAARTVESGELAARVPVTSRDEIGMVAEAFNQMTARLERQQQLRKQMVGDIAHELRTPLSVMQGTIEAMLDGVLNPNKTELRSLHNEIRRLTRMVEELRTLSLADEGQLRLELIDVDPASLVEQVTHGMLPMAKERGIELTAEVIHPLPTVRADGDRLAEVLTNLIGNALRYAPDGGHVTVSARHTEGQIVLAVRDDGPGIAQEDIPFVFERFWRGDKSRNRSSGGTGIGLAIVRHLVELHGGKISVESTLGRGTLFKVSLPLEEGGSRTAPSSDT